MDNPASWLLLLIFVAYLIFVFLRAVIQEDIRKKEEGQREWTRLYNEWREAEFRERYKNEERRYYYWTPRLSSKKAAGNQSL